MSFEIEKRKTYDHFVYFGSYVNVDCFDCLLQLNISYVISKYQIWNNIYIKENVMKYHWLLLSVLNREILEHAARRKKEIL